MFYDFLKSDKFQLVNSNLIFQNSVFRCIVCGSISQPNSDNHIYCGFIYTVEDLSLDYALRQFCEMEQVDITEKTKSAEDHASK